jgi:alpha-galactosidase
MPTEIITGAGVEMPAVGARRFYAHGWHSWCRTRWVDPNTRWRPIANRVDRLGHDDPVHAFDDALGGSAVGAVDHGDGEVSLLGALEPGGWVSLVGDSLVGSYEGDGRRWLAAHGDQDAVFAAYALALADGLGRRGGTDVRLWSSWYGLYEGIDAGRLEAVIDGLGALAFDVVQIDDGWQRAIGDWAPNAKFPEGVAPLAEQIRATHRRAGLWVSPFIAAPQSEPATRHPEMLLRDSSGEPVIAGENWGAPYYALDVTHPATEAHLRRLFAELRDWGFDFFKLDFVYAAAYPGRHHAGMDRELAYRRGLEIIRETVGDDAYLLACGAPIVASIGVCDGIRVGPDVGPWWVAPDSDDPAVGIGARNAVATSVNRLWLRPAIDTDPDVAYFRSEGVALDDISKQRLQQLAHIAGFRGISDPPEWLTQEERAALAAFLDATPAIARTSRYRWRVDGEDVDFTSALVGSASARGAAS